MIFHTRDIPALSIRPKSIDAQHFNCVRLALIRLGSPLRFKLDGVGKADIILSEEEWLCVDRSRDDLPLMAWTDFESKRRDSLHEPISCKLHFYHTHAGMLAGKVLPELIAKLKQRLRDFA